MTKEDFLDFVQEKAVILGDDDFDTNSHYVTLSTCAYNYDEARTQVIGVLQDPALETVKETKMINKYTKINHWLLLQIAIGIIMAVSVIFLLVGQIKSTKRPRYQSKH